MPMHKRLWCMLLAAALLLSLIPAFALPTQAASNMKTSEECIAILKKMEGFVKYPIYDHGQYSVGYGSGCGKDDYPNGITEEEADALLREYLEDMEKAVNGFVNRSKIVLPQNQFDALMLFTYNCGPNWVNGDGDFRQAVLDGTMGNNFLFYITQWSSASSQLHMGLVNRRLIEADMYLNGSYENRKPENYTYVVYDNNEGVGQAKVQGYDYDMPAYVKPVPTRENYRFLGWYSEAENGLWVTALTKDHAEMTLYAHWQENTVTADQGVPAQYDIPSAQLVSRDYFNAPGGEVRGSLNESARAYIVAEYVDDSGMKWGRLPNNCWVKLGDPRLGTGDDTEVIVGVEVTVTGDYVNVRTGPGTNFKAIAAVLEGDKVLITQTKMVDNILWGKFRAGWICLDYTDYSGGVSSDAPDEDLPQPDAEKPIAIGTVKVNGLNIRAAAGTHGYLMGSYKWGDKVEIFEKTTVSGTPWGRTDKGWICLTYVTLETVSDKPEDETAESTEPETTETEATEPETEATVPSTNPEEGVEEKPQGIPGIVTSKTGLNIRSGPGTDYPVVTSYPSGSRIVILEQKTQNGVSWGRTDKGWVSMQYVKLEEKWCNENGVYATVISAGTLNIRAGAGVAYARVGSYNPGERIIIFEQTSVAGQKWGRTDKGWVCMDFVMLEEAVSKPGQTETTGPEETTKPGETTQPEETTKPEDPTVPEEQDTTVSGTVTAGGLNIRETPGTNGKIVGGYQRGDRVIILEQKQVNGTLWGRTDRGWISLSYVKLDETTADGSNTVTVVADLLRIRKGPGTGNAVVGSYKFGEKVTILETTRVGATLWGRTDKGWICMDYVQ